MENLDCVLLIDDDPIVNALNKRILSKADVVKDIKVALNGKEGIEYLRQAIEQPNNEAHPLPNLIFLDLNMPQMNGWEFLIEFEQLARQEQLKIPVVVLTSSPNPDDANRAHANALVAYFKVKPLTETNLNEIVNHVEIS